MFASCLERWIEAPCALPAVAAAVPAAARHPLHHHVPGDGGADDRALMLAGRADDTHRGVMPSTAISWARACRSIRQTGRPSLPNNRPGPFVYGPGKHRLRALFEGVPSSKPHVTQTIAAWLSTRTKHTMSHITIEWPQVHKLKRQ